MAQTGARAIENSREDFERRSQVPLPIVSTAVNYLVLCGVSNGYRGTAKKSPAARCPKIGIRIVDTWTARNSRLLFTDSSTALNV